MTSSALSDSGRVEHVEIVFPADVDFVVIGRFAAATVAARANFDLDEIEDLRLAVDELCISFGPMSEYRSVRLEFVRTDQLVRAICTFESADDNSATGSDEGLDWKRTDDLSRQLLDALVDAHGREAVGGIRCAWLEKRGHVTY
jgi:hypothetical protein